LTVKDAHRIQFLDAFVRKRHVATMAWLIGVMLAVCVPAGIWGRAEGLTQIQLRLILISTSVGIVAYFEIRERIKRRSYGLYILPHRLLLKFHEQHDLKLQPNAQGDPLVIIRKVGRKYEITTASHKKAIYLPVAAIPTLPTLLLHYELDVKLIEST
jgi:hypothetical protein